jgi:FkbM family methyltransferase
MPIEVQQRSANPVRALLRAGMRASRLLFPSRMTVRQTTWEGGPLLVWANEYIGRRILTTGNFEADDLARLHSLVALGDCCIDVGANIGLYALALGRLVGPKGLVLAFEPVARNALLTELNCELNGLSNVQVFRMPLSDVSGKSLNATAPEGDSAYTYFSEGAADGHGMRSRTLDDICEANGIGKVALIKIDVEGAELLVLRGAEALLRSERRPHTIMLEVVDEYLQRFGNSTAELCAWLDARGYRPHVADGDHLRPVTAGEINVENVLFRCSSQ